MIVTLAFINRLDLQGDIITRGAAEMAVGKLPRGEALPLMLSLGGTQSIGEVKNFGVDGDKLNGEITFRGSAKRLYKQEIEKGVLVVRIAGVVFKTRMELRKELADSQGQMVRVVEAFVLTSVGLVYADRDPWKYQY